MTTNLENFTAHEQMDYAKSSYTGVPEENDTSTFDYVLAFEQSRESLVS